tara:strand:- start:79 stop:555 length:477 start_codon:yes stop_codon:yes gene_type:complete
MSKRLIALTSLVMILMLGSVVSTAHADGYGKSKGCYYKQKSSCKVLKKAKFMLHNQEELGLSDEQVKQIKDLKVKAKKEVIRKKAEIEILAIDIKAGMWADVIDANAINGLIDMKYELKKQKAKSLLSSYVELKNILTAEQKKTLKALFRKCKKACSK